MNKRQKLVATLSFTLGFGLFCAAEARETAKEKYQENQVIEYLAMTDKDLENYSSAPIEIEVEKTEVEEKTNVPEDEHDAAEVKPNATQEYSVYEIIDKDPKVDKPFKIEEESLFGKIFTMQVERTDVATHLLSDELTLKIDKGFVDKVRFFGAYQGNFNNSWTGSDHDLEYGWGFMDVGISGQTKDPNTSFLIRASVNPRSELDFWNRFITDAYIMNTKIPNHRVLVGSFRNQVGVEGGSGAYTLPFATRSQIGRTFGNTRALGVRIVGDYPLVDYDLAVNSSGRFWRNWFPGAEFTGWVNLKPLGKTDGKYGKLIVGGGLNAGHNDFTYAVGGAYIGYTYKKFMANFEYAIADGYNAFVRSQNKASGFYTTVGYRITPKIQLIARYDQFDPNRDISNNNRTEITAGINYFIKGQGLKLILNYVYCKNQAGPDSNRIILGTQILL